MGALFSSPKAVESEKVAAAQTKMDAPADDSVSATAKKERRRQGFESTKTSILEQSSGLKKVLG